MLECKTKTQNKKKIKNIQKKKLNAGKVILPTAAESLNVPFSKQSLQQSIWEA